MSYLNQHTLGGILSVALGVTLLVWLIPTWVEPDPDLRLPVSLVPQIVAIGFIACGVASLVVSLVSKPLENTPSAGFDTEEGRGFFLILLLLIVATVGFQVLHFLVVAPAMVAISMWMFGPVRPVSLVLTSALGPLVIWFVGTEVLGRVLP